MGPKALVFGSLDPLGSKEIVHGPCPESWAGLVKCLLMLYAFYSRSTISVYLGHEGLRFRLVRDPEVDVMGGTICG